MPTIGFRARLSVNDGASNAEQFFSTAITIALPEREYDEYEDKTLYTADKNRAFNPTLVNNGMMEAEAYFNKSDYARLVALHGVTGKVWKLYTPDEDGATVTLTPLLATLTGWLKKIGAVKFEKDVETKVPFTLRVNSITAADGTNDTSMP